MNVTIFVFDGLTALDAIGPYEALSRLPEMQIVFCALEPGVVHTQDGALGIEANASIFSVEKTDLLIVPGGSERAMSALLSNRALIAHIGKLHACDIYTASICTGAFLLGTAGLLQGLSVATHWRAKALLPKFGATYSGERVTRSGKIFTSAGVSAGIELGLVLCGAVAGDEVAAAVELSMEYSPNAPFGGIRDTDAPQAMIDTVTSRLR
jgi:transcriptional regulator GlxA family with amidase domain